MVGGVLSQWLTGFFIVRAECGFRSLSQVLIQLLFDSVVPHVERWSVDICLYDDFKLHRRQTFFSNKEDENQI